MVRPTAAWRRSRGFDELERVVTLRATEAGVAFERVESDPTLLAAAFSRPRAPRLRVSRQVGGDAFGGMEHGLVPEVFDLERTAAVGRDRGAAASQRARHD